MYGFCLLPIMLIFMAVGGALVALLQVSDEQIEEQCPKLVDYAMEQYFDDSENLLTEEEQATLHIYDLTFINTFMCTSVCPCKDVATKDQWLGMTEEDLEQWPKQMDLEDRFDLSFDFTGDFTTY